MVILKETFLSAFKKPTKLLIHASYGINRAFNIYWSLLAPISVFLLVRVKVHMNNLYSFFRYKDSWGKGELMHAVICFTSLLFQHSPLLVALWLVHTLLTTHYYVYIIKEVNSSTNQWGLYAVKIPRKYILSVCYTICSSMIIHARTCGTIASK